MSLYSEKPEAASACIVSCLAGHLIFFRPWERVVLGEATDANATLRVGIELGRGMLQQRHVVPRELQSSGRGAAPLIIARREHVQA